MTTPASSLVELTSTRSLRELYAELGRALLAQNRPADAVLSLKQALGETGVTPPGWELHYLLGLALHQTDDAAGAFRAYLEAAKEAPEHSAEMIRLARSILSERTVAANADWLFDGWASSILDHTALANAIKADAALFLGLSRLYLGQSDKAEAAFEQALSLRPGEPSMMMEIGEAFRRTGNLKQASEFLTAASALASKKASPEEIVLIKARNIELLIDQQKYSAALERTREIQTDDVRVQDQLLLARARSCLGLGRFDDALKALQQITHIKGEKLEIVRAQALLGLHRYDEVITTLRESQKDSTAADVALLTIQALVEGAIDLGQGERLLLNLKERLGFEPIEKWLNSSALETRKEDARVHFFRAYVSRTLAPDIPLTQALQEVEKAMSLRTNADGDLFDAVSWQLKAELLEAQNNSEAAALAHYEAGRRWYWARNLQTAEEQLLLAAKLNENYPATWWHLAEVRSSQSYTDSPPYVDEAIIRSALKDWETGIAKLGSLMPGADDSWCYVVRTLIAERFSNLPDEDTGEKLAEALTYLERAILHKHDDFYRWATLAREHRGLENEVNALHAVRHAEEYGADQAFVLEEKAAISCDIGANDEALATIATLNETAPHYVYDGWKSFVLFHERRYDEALELIQKSIAGDPNGLWGRSWRADIFAITFKLPSAIEEYEWIRSQRQNPNYKDSEFTFVRAAVMLGIINRTNQTLLEEASAEITRTFKTRSEAVSARLMLTLCRLAQNRLEEASAHFLNEFLPQISNRHYVQWTEIMIGWITNLARQQGWPHAARLEELVNGPKGFSVQLAARREEMINKQLSPIDELNKALADERRVQKGNWRWLALRSGLARLYKEDKNWDEARKLYESLLPETERFPEAQFALTELAESIATQGRELLKNGNFVEAQAAFEKYRSRLAAGEPGKMAEVYVLMGLAAAGTGNLARAHSELSDAVNLYQVAGTKDAGIEIGRISSEHISSTNHYWTVDGLLREMRGIPPDGIKQARTQLQPWLGSAYRLSEDSNLIPAVTPIAVEIGSDLAPPNENPDDWILLQEYVPAMRADIKEKMGVAVPGLRARLNETDMPGNSYIIMLDEVPTVMGSVEMGKCFCLASFEQLSEIGVPETALIAGQKPGGGQGTWINPEYQSLASENGFEIWADAYLYVVHHIRLLVEQNLTMFLGVQEVANLVEEWKQTEGGEKLVEAVVPDLTAAVRLGRVLRELLSEGVTIAPWRDILEAVREVGLIKDDVADIVRIVRLRLKEHLPGNDSRTKHVSLAPEVENRLLKWVQEQNGKRFLAIIPDETMEVLSEIRNIVPNDGGRAALVVGDARLRPMVRQLVSLEFPRLIVHSREEMI